MLSNVEKAPGIKISALGDALLQVALGAEEKSAGMLQLPDYKVVPNVV